MKPAICRGPRTRSSAAGSLNGIGKLCVEHLLECIAQRGMIAPEREHPPAAEQVEILAALRIIKVLPTCTLILAVESDGPQQAHHLLVQVTRMQRVALSLAL